MYPNTPINPKDRHNYLMCYLISSPPFPSPHTFYSLFITTHKTYMRASVFVIIVTRKALMLYIRRVTHYENETTFFQYSLNLIQTLFCFSCNIMGRPTYKQDVHRNAHTLNTPQLSDLMRGKGKSEKSVSRLLGVHFLPHSLAYRRVVRKPNN